MTLDAALVYALLGLCSGTLSYFLFLRMPERWMRDVEPEGEVVPLPSPRLRFFPLGLVWILVCAGLSVQALATHGSGVVAVLCAVALVPLSVLFATDCLTRILPDQGVVALAVVGVVLFALDLVPSLAGAVPGSLSAGTPWYLEAASRVGAGLAGGLLLIGVGWIGSRLFAGGREAMGMGDVKLLAAAGLVSGIVGLLAVLLVAFVTGAVFAVPALVRKYGHRSEEPEEGAEADATADADAAPVPDGTMPFGPFLVLGVVAVLFFQNVLAGIASWYLSLF